MKLPSVFLIGDSISIQYGPFLKQYLKGHFIYARKKGEAEALENLDLPAGANGGDSSMVLNYMLNNNQHHEIPMADYLLVNCGLHDIRTNPKTGEKQINQQDYRKNLQKIIDLSKKICKRMIWIRITPFNEKIHNTLEKRFHRFSDDCWKYNSIADKIMKINKIKMIDLYSFTLNLGKNLHCDHVHFKEDISQKQAAFIAGWLFHEL